MVMSGDTLCDGSTSRLEAILLIHDKFLRCLMLSGANKDRYAALKSDLHNQYGFGMSYTDVFTKSHVWKFGLKSIDLKYAHYSRDSGLTADMITGGFKFVME